MPQPCIELVVHTVKDARDAEAPRAGPYQGQQIGLVLHLGEGPNAAIGQSRRGGRREIFGAAFMNSIPAGVRKASP